MKCFHLEMATYDLLTGAFVLDCDGVLLCWCHNSQSAAREKVLWRDREDIGIRPREH